MSDFENKFQLFRTYLHEMHVDAAFDLVAQLGQRAVSVADHILLGFCQARVGLFAQAESTLGAVLPWLTPRSSHMIQLATELATVKYHLGKIEEASAIERQLHTRSWFVLQDPPHAGFAELFRERLLEAGDAINGKRIFLVFAGGYGDTIEQFRNIESLLAEGASQVWAYPAMPLRELMSNTAVAMTQRPATLDELAQCDHIALGNILNWRYWRDGAPVASRPDYMKQVLRRASPIHVVPQAGKRKIGLVWRSTKATEEECRHEPYRSMTLAALEPLLADAGSRFFSLQFGGLTASEQAMLARHDAVDAAPVIHSFADLADIVRQLDLVITIDSAPAHLCGALNVPVWNLLAQVCDWRWGDIACRSTPLYPSMRLFRQATLGAWAPVVAEVCAELAQFEVCES